MYELNDEKLKALKEQHGTVYLITVEDKAAVFRKPTRSDLSFATAASGQGKDAMKLTETILRNTFIEGDREIIDDDDYFLGAMPVAMDMVEAKQAEIKKL